MADNTYIIVFMTASSIDEATNIAEKLVAENLAACVNIIPDIKSVYIWEDKMCKDDEILCIIKSTKGMYSALEKRIKELHSYDVPEVICTRIEDGNPDYLNWIDSLVSQKGD